MELLIVILKTLAEVFLIAVFAANIVLFVRGTSISKLRSTYKNLNTMKFKVFPNNIIYDVNNDIGFINGSIYYGKNKYLLNMFVTYLSPFHLYWLKKYQRWFKENFK